MLLKLHQREGEAERVRVAGERFVIGRDEDCDLVLDGDPKVSRRHAYLKVRLDGRATLHDLGSSNGTWVDGRAVQSALLGGGERVRVGDTELVPEREPAPAPVTPAHEGSLVRRSQSAVARVMLQRSVRRASALGAAAVTIALGGSGLVASGVLERSSTEEIVRAVAPSTVLIDARRGEEQAGNGSGWVLDAKEGLVVTNAHVVNSGTAFKVGVGEDLRDARVVGVAPCEDLAVLRVADAAGLQALPLGSQSELELGEPVVAVGFPGSASLSSKLTSTTGVVSVVRSTYREPALDVPVYSNVIQTDAAINPGSSGGPLVNGDGELVGVNSAGRTKSAEGRVIQGQSYAVGVDRVKEITAVLREGRSIGWTGMSFEYPSAEGGAAPGLLVSGAVAGSAAERAGFGSKPLVVTAVDGTQVDRRLASWCDAVREVRSGDWANISVTDAGGGRSRDVRVRFE